MKKTFIIALAVAVILSACDNPADNNDNDNNYDHDAVITIADIQGVAVPVIGAAPVVAVTETPEYTGTVEWSPDPSDIFTAATAYTATITVTANEGYTLKGVNENFFTVNGAMAANGENSGVITAVFPATGASLAEWLASLRLSAQSNTRHEFTVSDEMLATQTLEKARLNYADNITIALNGGGEDSTLTLSDFGELFIVADGVTLELNNLTLQGRSGNSESLVFVQSGGALVMNAGAVITGNETISGGGGVFVRGTFTMNGGKISGNTDDTGFADDIAGGGGVFVRDDGTFIMNGGEISGNSAISSNNLGGASGGGVSVVGGTFTMSGGIISGNTTSSNTNGSHGGGVAVSGIGTFTMSGGTISGNTTSSNTIHTSGGGVVVFQSGTFVMHDGEISGNRASAGWSAGGAGGGGVHADGTFIMNNGTISGNTATSSSRYYSSFGGGVCAFGIFTMNGGTVSDNRATGVEDSSGGGVVVGDGTFIMNGGTVSDNRATTTATGEISMGGGLMVYSRGNFYMHDGVISGNSASFGGGVLSAGTVRISGGTIYGSSATGNLQNTATHDLHYGASLLIDSDTATAQYGIGDTWTNLYLYRWSNTSFRYTNSTIRVVEGVLQ